MQAAGAENPSGGRGWIRAYRTSLAGLRCRTKKQVKPVSSPDNGRRSLSHFVRSIEIGSPATIGEYGERLDQKLMFMEVADDDHLRKAKSVWNAEGCRRAGAHVRGVRAAWYDTPVARSGTAGAEDIDRDAAARGGNNYFYQVPGCLIDVLPGSQQRRWRYHGRRSPGFRNMRGSLVLMFRNCTH